MTSNNGMFRLSSLRALRPGTVRRMASLLMRTVIVGLSGVSVVHGAFMTVINSPPDSIDYFQRIGSNTQVNLYAGAVVPNDLALGAIREPSDNIEVNVYGGTINGSLTSNSFWTHNTNVVINLFEGEIARSLAAGDGSIVHMAGGRIAMSLGAGEGSIVSVTGGEIAWELEAVSGSVVKFQGGKIGHDLRAGGGSTVEVSGGDLAWGINAEGGSVTKVSGGSIGGFHTSSGGQLILEGGDFRLDGTPLTGLSNLGDALPFNLPAGSLLTGTLADGTPLAISDQSILGDYIVDGTLTLRAAAVAPALPATFYAPGSALPRGLRAGQRLVVQEGGVVSDNFNASWGSVVEVTGGAIGDRFEATGAVVEVAGGAIGELATAYQGAVVNISGGEIDSNFNAACGSMVNMSGGRVGMLFEALPGSEVNLSGGVVRPYFVAHPESRVAIAGSGFRLNGVPVSGLSEVGAARQVDVPAGAVLSGTFADGRQFAFSDQAYDFFAAGTLTLQTVAAPPAGPAVVRVPADAAPAGLQSGQMLVVSAGGAIGDDFNADWGSVINIDGGTVGRELEVVGAQVNITGGTVGGSFHAFYGSVVNFSEGTLEGSVHAHRGSVINVSGGRVGIYLTADRGGVVNVGGGTVDDYAQINEGGVLNVSGGLVGDGLNNYGGVLNLSGGAIGDDVGVYQNGAANISGGTMGDRLQASRGSRVLLTGSDFRLDGETIDGLPDYYPSVVDIPEGSVLSGTLLDGTPFALAGQDGDRFEPGAVRVMNWPYTLPDPPMMNLPTGPAPTGLPARRTLALGAAEALGDQFTAGWGSTLTVAGGEVGRNFEAVGAQVLITDGAIGDEADAFYGSVVTVAGGSIGHHFEAHRGSVVNVTGGAIGGGFTANSGSVVNVTGGVFANDLNVNPGSVVNISGGLIERIVFEGSAALHLFGTEFQLNYEPIAGLSPGETVEISLSDIPDISSLRGVLADGSPISLWLYNFVGAANEPSLGTLTVTSLLAADFVGDGRVDAADLARWSASFGNSAAGDADGDLDADGNDFLIWQRQVGNNLSTANASHQTPEPATLGIAISATIGVLLVKRRRACRAE